MSRFSIAALCERVPALPPSPRAAPRRTQHPNDTGSSGSNHQGAVAMARSCNADSAQTPLSVRRSDELPTLAVAESASRRCAADARQIPEEGGARRPTTVGSAACIISPRHRQLARSAVHEKYRRSAYFCKAIRATGQHGPVEHSTTPAAESEPLTSSMTSSTRLLTPRKDAHQVDIHRAVAALRPIHLPPP